ncbi:MAG TPA: spore germination protein GerW family protein [Thermoanaerobaculia bacterium]|nr:spore germination protein GerW family protein [Thermoanaerobaculia bacterium]
MAEKMAENEEWFRHLAHLFREAVGVRAVFGEPVSAHGRTVIPVARIAFGGGGGTGPSGARSVAGAADKSSRPGAYGGGGGVVAAPVGFLEIDGECTRFVRFDEGKRLLAALAAGFGLALLLTRRRS